jgi:hypothetical protein
MPPRRAVLLGLAIGLSIAAAIALVATLTQAFDGTDARLIGTSLGFSVFAALAGAGAPARRRPHLAALGTLTTAAAWAAFGLLELAIWVVAAGWIWRAFGIVAVVSLASAHASLMLSARRGGDSRLISLLSGISVLAAIVDAILAVIAIAGVVRVLDTNGIRLAAVLLITLLLSTALAPILRRASAELRENDPCLSRGSARGPRAPGRAA